MRISDWSSDVCSSDLYCYKTTLTVRITDINAANHLSNDAMISMISEARARFLYDFGITEPATGDTSVIVTDLATTYRADAHAPDQLQLEIGITDMNRYGADIILRITRPADGTQIRTAEGRDRVGQS